MGREGGELAWLSEIGSADVDRVGVKAATLGALAATGVDVPPGFVVPTTAFAAFLRQAGIEAQIAEALDGLDASDARRLHQAARTIQDAILSAPADPGLEAAILGAYDRLRASGGLQVAVRPSVVTHDLPSPALAGQQKSFLGVTGATRILDAVKHVWASLYTARSLYYRLHHSKESPVVHLAVLVQAMVPARVAGVLSTTDLTGGGRQQFRVEAVWGLGEAVTEGLLTPDQYLLDRETGRVLEQTVVRQPWQLEKPSGERQLRHVPVPASRQDVAKLNPEELHALWEAATAILKHQGGDREIEWAFADDRLLILEARPIQSVTRAVRVRGEHDRQARTPRIPLLTGRSASLGVATGSVRIIHSTDELDRVRAGDVLVAETTSPDFLPALERAAALVTNEGGRTSHAALVAQEFGIPAVVGTGTATHLLHEGQVVTVDGGSGQVFRGKLALSHADAAALRPRPRHRREAPRTATKVLVNLANPAHAKEAAQLPVDGVGLLRAEFMVARLRKHPKAFVAEGRRAEYVRALAQGIEAFASAFHPHPVVYRASDFKTNEYRGLPGGTQYEPAEENPMLGYRGTLRYLQEPDLFRAELEALMEVRGRRGFDNVSLMLPFVRTVEEFQRAKALVDASGLSADRRFKLLMMCEVPSNVFLIEAFLDAGVQGISIGTNDLTQLILGVDRDNAHLADHFDENDPAVKAAIRYVVAACRARHIPVSACGDAVSRSPAFAEFLVEEGVTSVSVRPDTALAVRELVASIEHQLHRTISRPGVRTLTGAPLRSAVRTA